MGEKNLGLLQVFCAALGMDMGTTPALSASLHSTEVHQFQSCELSAMWNLFYCLGSYKG